MPTLPFQVPTLAKRQVLKRLGAPPTQRRDRRSTAAPRTRPTHPVHGMPGTGWHAVVYARGSRNPTNNPGCSATPADPQSPAPMVVLHKRAPVAAKVASPAPSRLAAQLRTAVNRHKISTDVALCSHFTPHVATKSLQGLRTITTVTSVLNRCGGGGRMQTVESWQQEQLSLAYVAAVATRAGYTLGKWDVDKDGVDLSVKRSDGLQFEMQMKCTYSPKIIDQGRTYTYDLDIPTYDKLRVSTRTAVGFLGLVIAPELPDQWMIHDEEQILLFCAGYWAKIQDLPSVENKSTRCIHIPKVQRIDSPGLEIMFSHAEHRLMYGNQAMITS